MPYIRTIPPEDADGSLKRQYDAALQRAGRVYNVVRIQSLDPPVLDASIRLYRTLMLGPSSLERADREMLAVVVSRANDCFY
jgi:alkylhydroperoxidase family enzyme